MALDDRETPQTGEVSEVNPREDRSSNGWNERTRERRWFVLKRPRCDTNGASETEVTSVRALWFIRFISK